MSPEQARIKLYVDVFEETGQLANAAADLRPGHLTAAILQEFRGQERLGDNPDAYYLVNKATGEPLDADLTLGAQLRDNDTVALVEREAALPEGAQRPSQAIYLRELRTPRAFAIQWLPAIIGRRSEHQPHNELVAVDLRPYAAGVRVSRRHAQLSESDGRFYVENLSNNPVSLVSPGQPAPVPVGAARVPIAPGDIIRLDRSDIELKFIARGAAASDAVADAPDAAESVATDVPAEADAPDASAGGEQTQPA